MKAVAALLLVDDAYRESLLRRAEVALSQIAPELWPESLSQWKAYVDEDAQRLGAWRALMPLMVGG